MNLRFTDSNIYNLFSLIKTNFALKFNFFYDEFVPKNDPKNAHFVDNRLPNDLNAKLIFPHPRNKCTRDNNFSAKKGFLLYVMQLKIILSDIKTESLLTFRKVHYKKYFHY